MYANLSSWIWGPSQQDSYWCSFLLITSNVGNGHQQLHLPCFPYVKFQEKF